MTKHRQREYRPKEWRTIETKIHFDDPVVCGDQREVQYSTNYNSVTCENCRRVMGLSKLTNVDRTNIKHGLSGSRFKQIWANMRTRVLNKNCNMYKYYGGKGVSIEWRDFLEFKDDMYESYLEHVSAYGEKNSQIDRINSDGNYSKRNCKWATIVEQARNMSRNVRYNGELAIDASKRLGGARSLVTGRLSDGWNLEEAFTIPYKFRRIRVGK